MRAGPERAHPKGIALRAAPALRKALPDRGKSPGTRTHRQGVSVKVCERFGPRTTIPLCRHRRRLVLSCHTANIQAGARRLCSQGGKGSAPGPDDRNHRSFRAGLP